MDRRDVPSQPAAATAAPYLRRGAQRLLRAWLCTACAAVSAVTALAAVASAGPPGVGDRPDGDNPQFFLSPFVLSVH